MALKTEAEAREASLHLYHVVISIEPITPIDQLSYEDQDDPLLTEGGDLSYLVLSSDAQSADDLALDNFHDHNAIAVLDDFSITSEVRIPSNHEKLAMLERFPRLQTQTVSFICTMDQG